MSENILICGKIQDFSLKVSRPKEEDAAGGKDAFNVVVVDRAH